MENKTEYIPCNLCGEEQNRVLFDMEPFKVVRCINCKLIYVNPRLKEDVCKRIYQNGYFVNQDFFSGKTEKIYGYHNYKEEMRNVESMYQIIFRKIESVKKTKGRILEIGSAYGYFLNIAKKNGWGVEGIELSREAAEYSKNHFNINPFCDDLYQYPMKEKEFDVIVAFDVIEHLHNPSQSLRLINRMLKKDGLIVFAVPNSDEWVLWLLGERWEDLKRASSNEHLYFFSKKTLKRILAKTGFKYLSIKTMGRKFNIHHLAQRLQVYHKPIFSFAEKFIELFGLTKLNFYVNPGLKLIIFAQKKNDEN